jgi:hypothetical protein
MKSEKTIARIFQEVTGKYHICCNSLPYLDARGAEYVSRREAIAALRRQVEEPHAFTHYLRSGGRLAKIPTEGSR